MATEYLNKTGLQTLVNKIKELFQKKTDNSLTTDSKTIVGAINELDKDLNTEKNKLIAYSNLDPTLKDLYNLAFPIGGSYYKGNTVSLYMYSEATESDLVQNASNIEGMKAILLESSYYNNSYNFLIPISISAPEIMGVDLRGFISINPALDPLPTKYYHGVAFTAATPTEQVTNSDIYSVLITTFFTTSDEIAARVTLKKMGTEDLIATNIKNSGAAGGLDQAHDSGDTFDFTNKNPKAATYDSTLTGTLTKGASGSYASSFGGKSIASGKRSFAEGTLTIAKGDYSHAEGGDTVTLGAEAHAEGYMTTAVGQASHSEGNNTVAEALYSHAEGDQTLASGNVSHAEGYLTKATHPYSHAEGQHTTASGDTSHAEGNLSTASGTDSHAESYNTTASGASSHAEGMSTIASGSGSHAEGNASKSQGADSHAEGNRTTAYSPSSHAEGYGSYAGGTYSHAEGYYTKTSNDAEHASGKYNKSNTGTIFSVGIGTSNTNRKNALEVDSSGNIYVTGVGGYTGVLSSTSKSIQSEINNLSINIIDLE